MPQNSPQWYRDEEYRQSVIRKALLLGFSAMEHPAYLVSLQSGSHTVITGAHRNDKTWWSFHFEGTERTGYKTLYSAAHDYLRVLKVPPEVIGDYRG